MDKGTMYPLYTGEQVKQGEVRAAKLAGISLYDLMQRAGFATYQLFTRYYSHANRVLVLCGTGNNGGDGYITATLVKQAGYTVELVSVGDHSKLSGDAKIAKQEWQSSGGAIHDVAALDRVLMNSDVIIDGMLGIGLKGDVRSGIAEIISKVNSAKVNHTYKPVIAIDIPSGLCADTGAVLGASIQADRTITFIGIKRGLVTGKARDVVGHLHFSSLDVSNEFYSVVTTNIQTLDLDCQVAKFPKRKATSHKGSYGRLVCVGGNLGYSGAIRLCTMAAARAGAGLVSCLCHPSSLLAVQVAVPEVMALSVEQSVTHMVKDKLISANVIALGPGLGQNEWATMLFKQIQAMNVSKVFDADALNLLAKTPNYDAQRVLTPHPGEAARLLGITTAEVERDRYQAIVDLQECYGGVVVLKGAGTLIYDGESLDVCRAGNPGMASGGMGDVLTGIIAALIAQGLSLAASAKLGVILHSYSADREVQEKGQVGLLASDIIPQVRKLLNRA